MSDLINEEEFKEVYFHEGFENLNKAEMAVHIWNYCNTRSQWISVEDRLPEEGQPVLAWIEHYKGQRTHMVNLVRVKEDDCSWRVYDTGTYMDELSFDYNVKFWQPLPPPPNTDARSNERQDEEDR